MYCPVCGAQSTQGLNFCKRCGAAMNASASPDLAEPRISLGKLTGIFWAIAVFGVGSISVLVSGALGAIALGGSGDVIGVVTSIGFFVIFAICWLLTRQLARIINTTQITERPPKAEKRRKRANAYEAPQLGAPPLAVPSVTEHTTRNFDPARREESERKG